MAPYSYKRLLYCLYTVNGERLFKSCPKLAHKLCLKFLIVDKVQEEARLKKRTLFSRLTPYYIIQTP